MRSRRIDSTKKGSHIKVLHIITDLGQGGAEAVTHRLICATLRQFEHSVVSLHRLGVYGARLQELGVPVTALEMSRGTVTPGGLSHLRRLIRDNAPDVIQTRLYHADLIGSWVARVASDAPIVWGVHTTDLGTLRGAWKTRAVRRLCAWSSRSLPFAIVSDARSTADLHAGLGYPAAKLIVIRNGVDAELFQRRPDVRTRVRATWGVQPDETLLGCVARWDPLKDHENLLQAIALLRQRGLRFRCALVGTGMTRENLELQRLIGQYQIEDSTILVGPTNDVPGAMSALDLHVLPSRSESLPVAVIEAMACKTPCVVTNVGDAADIVGDIGWVVPRENAPALAAGIDAALSAFREDNFGSLGERCRTRVVREFSLAQMADEYGALWRRALGPSAHGAAGTVP